MKLLKQLLIPIAFIVDFGLALGITKFIEIRTDDGAYALLFYCLGIFMVLLYTSVYLVRKIK